MKTYIAILRGINVSGQKLIKMDALRKMFEKMDFENVKSYVQSGNIIYSGKETDLQTLENRISHQIKEDFGFDVPVIVLTPEKLRRVVDENPFLRDPDKNPAYLHATFLAAKPENFDLQVIESKRQNGEELLIVGDVAYLYCPNGYGNTKLNNNFLESKLKTGATTRNWKTTLELLRMSSDLLF